jgi:hypothetical protein
MTSRNQAGATTGNDAIGAALGRIFQGTAGSVGNPTIAVDRVTAQAALAQRSLTLQAGEVVVYASRRHGLALVGALSALIALTAGLGVAVWRFTIPIPLDYVLVACLGPITWAAWLVHEWRVLLHVLTTHRVLEIRCSWLERPIPRAVSLSTIEEVHSRRITLVGALCRVGTLIVHESGGDRSLRLRAVANPDALQQRLNESIEAARRLSKIREQERLASTLTDWFEEYHRLQLQS